MTSGLQTPEDILRGYDPFALAALPPFGFSPQAGVSLLSLSENATYRVDDAADGRVAVLRVHRTGYHEPGAIASELAWLQALRRRRGPAHPGCVQSRQRGRGGRRPARRPHPADSAVRAATRLRAAVGAVRRTGSAVRDAGRDLRPNAQALARLGQARFLRAVLLGLRQLRRAAGRWGRWQDGIGVGPHEHSVLARAADLMRQRLQRFGTGRRPFRAHPRGHAAGQPSRSTATISRSSTSTIAVSAGSCSISAHRSASLSMIRKFPTCATRGLLATGGFSAGGCRCRGDPHLCPVAPAAARGLGWLAQVRRCGS